MNLRLPLCETELPEEKEEADRGAKALLLFTLTRDIRGFIQCAHVFTPYARGPAAKIAGA